MQGAVSALEMACWDIIGKAAGKPVYELLGGRVHETLRTYTYLYPEPDDRSDVYVDPDLAAERAVAEVERGFTAVKFDPAGPYTAMGPHQPSLARLDLSERFVHAIREAVGDRADLLFGTHGQFTAGGALRLARRLEPYDPLWFEEPVPPDDLAAWRRWPRRRRSRSPPASASPPSTSSPGCSRPGRHRSSSSTSARAGGLLEGKKIAAMAEAFGAQIAPHCYNGPIGAAANIQLATCSPNFLILEAIRRLRRLPRRAADDADPVGTRSDRPADRARPRRRARRGRRPGPPVHR